MSGCQSCNSCEGCNSCQGCNACQSCVTGCDVEGCQTRQSFVDQNMKPGPFSWGTNRTSANSLFFTKAEWNSLITYINNAFAKGATSINNNSNSGTGMEAPATGGSSGLPASDPNDFMTAEMFNKVALALSSLGSATATFTDPVSNTTKTSMVKDVDIVWGSYFTSLESYANNLQYKTCQCDTCNVGCNLGCNTCLYCNVGNCESCVSGCQSNSPEDCCSYCDGCEGCDTDCESEETSEPPTI